MAAYKWQHYVPQSYLRNFSSDGKRINLLLLASGKTIQNAGIKGQCASDYFYSKDPKIEQLLSEVIEGPAKAVIAEIIQTGQLPSVLSEKMAILLTFVSSLHGRTLAAQRGMDKMVEQYGLFVAEGLARTSGKFKREELKKVRLKAENTALWSLGISIQIVPLILDLKAVLLKSDQGDFITSDHPVVAINPYMEGVWNGSNTGFFLRGLQIILPLSPELALFLYDGEVYDVTGTTGAPLSLSASDVETLNILQLISAEQAAFYRDVSEQSTVEELQRRSHGSRRTDRSAANTITNTNADGTETLTLHTYRVDIEMPSAVSFFSVNSKFTKIPKHEREPMTVRHPERVAFFEEFRKEVARGRYTPGDFFRYMESFRARHALRGPIAQRL